MNADDAQKVPKRSGGLQESGNLFSGSAAASAAPLVPDRQGGQFFGIHLSSLLVDTITDFDLYLDVPGKPPVLYRRARVPFTRETRERLVKAQTDRLFVIKDQSEAYSRYVETNLGPILADEHIPLDERAGMLYDSSRFVMRQVMSDPRAGNMLARAGNLVDHTADFLLRQSDALQSLMRLTSYDYYTYTHSVDVFLFCLALAQRLGYDEMSVREFGHGALLHDIGKSRIAPDIVNCRGKLNNEQWREMRKHPEYGHGILIEMGVTSQIVLDVTRHHHEKLSGRGYPDRLKGDQISLWVRISTVCDIFDALTTRRSYKAAMNSFPSLKLMREEMAGEIDMDIFRAFITMLGVSQ